VINFVEGLIGLPFLKNAVLIECADFFPFQWLASTEDESCRFIVVEPGLVFENFDTKGFVEEAAAGTELDPDTVVLSIVNVSSDWEKTTFNLRAPIILNPNTRKAGQVILSNSKFQLAEKLPG
jgi:flagellar assembly factor FliW